MSDVGLRVRGVHHAFARREVLASVDLDVGAGEAVALVGPSGCGKTTLLHLCAGLRAPSEGSIENGFAHTAVVFQQPQLLPWKSALHNVALGLAARGVARSEREHRARALALRMGLSHADLDKYPHQLSGGMRSRVALARALVLEADLLLLDEPFSALDVGLVEELYGLLLEHRSGARMAMLMITHDLMEAVRLSDVILVMAPEPGRIVARFALAPAAHERDEAWIHRTTAELLRRPSVRTSFGLPVREGRAERAPARPEPERSGAPEPGIREIAVGASVVALARTKSRC